MSRALSARLVFRGFQDHPQRWLPEEPRTKQLQIARPLEDLALHGPTSHRENPSP